MIVSISASQSKQYDQNSTEWKSFSEKIPILPPPTAIQRTAVIYSRVSGQSQPPHASILNYTSSFQSETVIARGLMNPEISPDFCYRYQMNFEMFGGNNFTPLEVVTNAGFEILKSPQIDSRDVYKIDSYKDVGEMQDLAARGIRSVINTFLRHPADQMIDASTVQRPANLILGYLDWKSLLETMVARD